MGKQLIDDAKREAMFLVDPFSIVLIGRDTKDGPEHPLYDERVHLEPSEELIASISAVGNIEPVIVRKNGDKIECVAGRQRVLAAREGSNRREKNGSSDPLIKIRAIARKGDDLDMMEVLIAENAHRLQENVVEAAKKAIRMKHIGATDERLCRAFGWGEQTLRQNLLLLDLDKKVLKAVQDGRLGAVAASRLAMLSREEQVAEFDKLEAEGKLNTAEISVAVQNKKREKKAKKNGNGNSDRQYVPPSRAVYRKLVKGVSEEEVELDETIVQMLRWSAGLVSARAVPGLSPALRKLGLVKEEE